MRAILKLSIAIAAAVLVQQGVDAVCVNAAEIEFQWRLEMAMLRGLPTDTPEFLDMAEPLLGFVVYEPPAIESDESFEEWG